MTTNRLAGHSLPHEGAVYGGTGIRKREGATRCTCGTASPVLSSDSARRKWHREHKDDIRAGGRS